MPQKTEHAKCLHASGPVIMKRVYCRDAYGFKPCGWICPDCRQFKPDK